MAQQTEANEGDNVQIKYDSVYGGTKTVSGTVTSTSGGIHVDTGNERDDGSPIVYRVGSLSDVETIGPKRTQKIGQDAVVTVKEDTEDNTESEDWKTMSSEECKKEAGLTQVNGVVWEKDQSSPSCPNCNSLELKEGVATESLKTFDYGCKDCSAVFMEADA